MYVYILYIYIIPLKLHLSQRQQPFPDPYVFCCCPCLFLMCPGFFFGNIGEVFRGGGESPKSLTTLVGAISGMTRDNILQKITTFQEQI